MKSFLLLLLTASFLVAAKPSRDAVSVHMLPDPVAKINGKEPPQANAAAASSWEMVWDDKIDNSLDRQDKVCRLRLAFRNGKVTGHFNGPVLGLPREARFVGKLIPSDSTSL